MKRKPLQKYIVILKREGRFIKSFLSKTKAKRYIQDANKFASYPNAYGLITRKKYLGNPITKFEILKVQGKYLVFRPTDGKFLGRFQNQIQAMKEIAKHGKIKTYYPALKNPPNFFAFLEDPRVYSSVVSPAAKSLHQKFKAGKFSKIEWVKRFFAASKTAARMYERHTGRKLSRKEIFKAAVTLAKKAFQSYVKGRK